MKIQKNWLLAGLLVLSGPTLADTRDHDRRNLSEPNSRQRSSVNGLRIPIAYCNRVCLLRHALEAPAKEPKADGLLWRALQRVTEDACQVPIPPSLANREGATVQAFLPSLDEAVAQCGALYGQASGGLDCGPGGKSFATETPYVRHALERLELELEAEAERGGPTRELGGVGVFSLVGTGNSMNFLVRGVVTL
jgi:hypothetical protein